MADSIEDSDIVDAALNPSSASADGQSVSARPIADLIAAQKHQQANSALAGGKSAWGRTRMARVVPPGTVGPGEQ